MPGRSSVDDPLKVFRFRVEIDEFVRAGFTDVSGLSDESEVTEYREGGDNASVRKSPGLASFGDVTLKRGQIVNSTVGGDLDMWDWRRKVHEANVNGQKQDFRKTVDIVQYDRSGAEVRRWRLYEAWPKSLTPASDFSATSSDDSMEEMVLVHEGYELVKN